MLQKRGVDIEPLKKLIELLVNEEELPPQYLDHLLKGNWQGYRDAHIQPDWLLIYKLEGNLVRFERTWRHLDLFNKY